MRTCLHRRIADAPRQTRRCNAVRPERALDAGGDVMDPVGCLAGDRALMARGCAAPS
jgi:hypothetical protein